MSAEAVPMTQEQLNAVVADGIKSQMGPILKEVLEPFTKSTSDFASIFQRQMDREDAKPDNEEKGLKFARAAKIIALGKGDPARGLFEARKHWGAHNVDSDPVCKALTAGNAAAAGNLIAPAWSGEFIELLRNKEVFGRIPGVRYPPMPSGSLTFRKQTAAGTATYTTESPGTPVTPTEQAVGTVTLSAKKLVAITAVSNDLLRQAGPVADAFVRDDLLAVVMLKRDVTFITGDTTLGTPNGFINELAASQSFAETGTTLAAIQADYTKLIRLVEEANVDVSPSNSAYVMSARVRWAIYRQATTTGDMLFAADIAAGRLFGFPIVTSQQPGNARVLFVHGPSVLIGQTLNMQVEADNGAAYFDGSAVVSGFSRDETAIRIIDEHDFKLRHDVGGSLLTTVTLV